jgi:hypothetical protein
VDVLAVFGELGEGLDRSGGARRSWRNADSGTSLSRPYVVPSGSLLLILTPLLLVTLALRHALGRPPTHDGLVDGEDVSVELLVRQWGPSFIRLRVAVAHAQTGDTIVHHSAFVTHLASARDDGDTLKRERVLGVHYISRILRPNLINMDPFSGTTLKKYWILLFRVMLLLRR